MTKHVSSCTAQDQAGGEVLDELARRRKRLLFRSQRCGIHENDLVIGSFAQAHVADLDAEQIAQFEALLAQNDIDLFHWISGQKPPPSQLDTDVLRMIQNFVKKL